MLARLGLTDITGYIASSSYSVNKTAQYESWKDGNGYTHKIKTREKISGQFNVELYGRDDMDLEAFLGLLSTYTANDILTISLYVNNTAAFDVVRCYYTLTSKSHTELPNGKVVDILTIKIEER